MTPLDRNYLSLQFRDKVHKKNATEYQTFFEEVIGKHNTGFRKVSSGGGDGGNDGYVVGTGTYYQVYAPKTPADKKLTASDKFEKDFSTLKENWGHIEEVKEFNFVFNDKYDGTRHSLEETAAKLKKENPGIEFKVFLAEDLEDIFFQLPPEEIKNLGFDIDSTNAFKAISSHIEKLETELDRNNANFVLKTLENIKTIISDQNDEELLLEYELLEARALQRIEKIPEARKQYESLAIRYPKDPRATLYLAELYLNDEDFEKNEELITKAEVIDSSHWLLGLEKLIRDFRLGKDIDLNKIDEKDFPSNPRVKSDYYRIYSLFIEKAGDIERSDSFIERAIHFNPDKFSCYDVKLSHLEERFLLKKTDLETKQKEAEQLLKQIEEVEQKLREWDGLAPKHQALLNIKKMHILNVIENYPEFERIAKETFDLILNCYFDYGVDRIICNLIQFIALPEKDLEKLFGYLANVEKPISDYLAQTLFLQFVHKNNLYTEGKAFFEANSKDNFVEIIKTLEEKNYAKTIELIGDDLQFLVALCTSDEMPSELRKEIIKALPDDGTLKKDKLVLLDLYHDKNYDGAFEVLQKLDIPSLGYIECVPMVAIAHQVKAWDVVIPLTEKLLKFETAPQSILKLELDLFTANLNLDRFPEVIRIGESILSDTEKMNLIDDENKEILLVQTLYAWARRGKYPEARILLDKNLTLLKKFETKTSVQAEIYLKNSDPEAAIKSLVEAVKIVKRPSPEEYGSLFFTFSQIGNLIDYPLVSEEEITDNVFVKVKNEERWLYLGNQDELDATKLPASHSELYFGKKVGDKVVLENKYSSEKTEQEIELILPIDKYILWQSNYHAQKLSKDGMWDVMKSIEVPTTPDGNIDPKFLIAILEDQNQRGAEFFETYCEQNVPFAMLALSEGGLPQAIGKLQNEQRGFIKFSDGTQKEFDEQKKIAEQIISGQEFYIDGTSALILGETGLLKKIWGHLPGIKAPQSVITLLLELSERFEISPGQVGRMSYSQGKIAFTDIDAEKQAEVRQNFLDAIELLESKDGIEVISAANKSQAFSEQQIAPSLSDATILAQKNKTPVLTEDFLYLHLNELDTKKEKPPYCSALALVRVLYEQGKISFEDYINFFGYISSYRFKFLPIAIEDMEKAVFGDGAINVVNEKGLRKLNIGLTLSEEYGVPPKVSHSLIVRFLIKLLLDNAVTPQVIEGVFADIVNLFPTKQDRQVFGRSLIVASVQILNKGMTLVVANQNTQEKINTLTEYIQNYDASHNILKL